MASAPLFDAANAADVDVNDKDAILRDVRAYRLARVQEQLRKHKVPAILLYDPVNIRYATDTSNMQVWAGQFRALRHGVRRWSHRRVRVSQQRTRAWDGLNLDVELRGAMSWTYFNAGPEAERRAQTWGTEVVDVLRKHAPGDSVLAVDRLDPFGTAYLERQGFTLFDGQALMESARLIKSSGELVLMGESLRTAEKGIERMRQEMRPGITENEVWAHLHFENIRNGGEWIETRLLASGDRTNPWIHECTSRVLQRGELLAFDTDMVGPNGYCSDISRTWLVGDGRPSDEQRKLYELAYTQVHFNMNVLRVGMSFREFSEKAWKIPEPYIKNRYCCLAHGIDMVDEYPSIAHRVDWDSAGYDGIFETGMTVCVESYIGADGGSEGVKLEQQVVLTERGCVPLTTCSFETDWL